MGSQNIGYTHPQASYQTKMIEYIKKAINDKHMMTHDYNLCPWSCSYKILKYIEDLEDPRFLLQDLVMCGGRTTKQDNWKIALESFQSFENPNDPFPPKPKKILKALGDLKLEIEEPAKVNPM